MQPNKIEDIYTLTPAQQGLLFHVLSDPASEMYVEQGACTIDGEVSVDTFERAWRLVVERHASLRTGFVWSGISKPVQVVHKQVESPLLRYDWRNLTTPEQDAELEACIRSDRARCSMLSEPPLMRLTLARVSDDSYRFVWSGHHLIHDAWSLSLIFQDFFAFYEAIRRGEREINLPPVRPYRDYVSWLKGRQLFEAEEFWTQKLKGFTKPTIIRDACRKLNGSAPESGPEDELYGREELHLSVTQTSSLQSLLRSYQLTLSSMVHGIMALLLSHYSAQDDLVFGTVFSGRPTSLQGAENIVGLFINTLPFRIQVQHETPLIEWLKTLQDELLKIRQYEHAPLGAVQNWSEIPKGVPLFEMILVTQNAFAGINEIDSGSLRIGEVKTVGHPNYPFTLRVTPGERVWLEILYDRRRFNSQFITEALENLDVLTVLALERSSAPLKTYLEKLRETESLRVAESVSQRRELIARKLRSIKPKTVNGTINAGG